MPQEEIETLVISGAVVHPEGHSLFPQIGISVHQAEGLLSIFRESDQAFLLSYERCCFRGHDEQGLYVMEVKTAQGTFLEDPDQLNEKMLACSAVAILVRLLGVNHSIRRPFQRWPNC